MACSKNLFEKQPAKFQELVGELAEAEKAHAAAEEQWLELEMLREELEGG